MTLPEIIDQLEGFSTKDLERLAHRINVILYARDEGHVKSFAKKQTQQKLDPLSQLVREAQSWKEFAKHHEISPDMAYWINKILIARDKQREIELL